MAPRRSTSKRVLVTIHGAGVWPKDYAQATVTTIADILKHDIEYQAAYYGTFIDQVNRGRALQVSRSVRAQKMRADFERELRQAYARSKAAKRRVPFARVQIAGLFDGPAVLIQHIIGYLTNPGLAEKIQARLIDAIERAKPDRNEIVLLSHSLGTVVAFDVLRGKDRGYNVEQWFTAGCPLNLLHNVGFVDTDLGSIPKQVKQWTNLYDTDDWVAGSLQKFATSQLPIEDWKIQIAEEMPAAHDYFNNCATRGIVTDAMR